MSRTDPFVQWVLNIPNGVACLTFPISSFRRIVDTWFIDLEVQLSGGNYVAADGSNEGFARVSFTTTNSGSDEGLGGIARLPAWSGSRAPLAAAGGQWRRRGGNRRNVALIRI